MITRRIEEDDNDEFVLAAEKFCQRYENLQKNRNSNAANIGSLPFWIGFWRAYKDSHARVLCKEIEELQFKQQLVEGENLELTENSRTVHKRQSDIVGTQ